jgi:hypothetical protein
MRSVEPVVGSDPSDPIAPVHSAHIADVSYKRLTRAVDLTGAVAITFVL